MASNKTTRIEKYLPVTICQAEMGLVFNISNVPALNSSESERIVMAGTRNIKIHGANSKNLSNEAYPNAKMLLSFKTNRNTPFINKNRIMAIYPVRLLKN